MKILRSPFLLIYTFFVLFISPTVLETFAQNYQSPNAIKVTILSLQAKSSDSCNGRMDFYGRMKINNHPFAFNNIVEGNTIYPYWNGTTSAYGDYNWVTIQILDEDDAFCGGGDDIVDISPASYVAELNLRIDTSTRHIYDVSDPNSQPNYVGMVGQQLILHGFDSYTHFSWAGSRGPGRQVKGHSQRNVETGVIYFIVDLF